MYREARGETTQGLRELLGLFRSNDVEFLVVGGHAVAFHGYPRFTEDLALFVRPSTHNKSRIVQALREFGFVSLGIQPADFEADDRMIQPGRAPNGVDLLTRPAAPQTGASVPTLRRNRWNGATTSRSTASCASRVLAPTSNS